MTKLRRNKRAYLEGIVCQSQKHPQKLCTDINKIMGRCARTSIQLLLMKSEDLLDTRDIDKAISTFFINWIKYMAAGINDETSGSSHTEYELMNASVP